MKIAIVASEAVPFSKTGGLADVTGTLFKEYSKMGKDVFLFVPLYRKTKEEFGEKIHDTGIEFDILLGNQAKKCRLKTLQTIKKNTKVGRVVFIANDELFDRDELYGTAHGDYPDNDMRFVFFCKSFIEACKRLDICFDIIHCHDWQTGLIPLYIKTLYKDVSVFKDTKTIITIHNIGYQGIFPAHTLYITGLDWQIFNPEGIEFYGNLNLLKAGILWADAVATVSKTYAREIITPEFGFGLDGVMRKRADSLFGVSNGIDYDEWNPSTDRFLPARYNTSRLSGKLKCKGKLIKICSFSDELNLESRIPILCFIGRLVYQKGIDLLIEAIHRLVENNLYIVIIGKGDDYYIRQIDSLKIRMGRRLFFYCGFDDAFAHLAYAGSDIFLMPSRYEPCGLGQIIAMRYGTIPVARKTGGLVDTIEDCSKDYSKCTGFLFEGYSVDAFIEKIRGAIDAYSNKKSWDRIIRNAMSRDFSWEKSANMYLDIYRKIRS